MLLLRRSAGLFILALILLFVGSAPAAAHVRDTGGYSTIIGEGREVAYRLSLEYEMLARTVDLGPQSLEAREDSERQAALDNNRSALATYLDDRLVLSLDGAACRQELTGVSPEERDGAPFTRLELVFTCPGSSGRYVLNYNVFSTTDAVAEDHTNLVDYRLGGHEGRTLLDGSRREFSVGDTSFLGSNLQFGTMGLEHFLTGLDHVLFVVALLLGATGFRNLAAVASMFTLAHSITLISALLGWVNVPAAVVEPLIALSIVFVALENLLGASRQRLAVVFLFGLLHGLGFAGSLRVTDDVSWNMVASLLSFNLGIEAGQLALLTVLFPLLMLARRSRGSVPVLRGATILVAVVGFVWFIERVFFS